MKDLQTLLAEATKLNQEIGRILKASTFSDYNDLSELDIDTRDGEQIFLRDQLYHIMDKLADVQSCIEYLNLPIGTITRLHRNDYGQYETTEGDCLHCGYPLEALISDEYHAVPYWARTRIEHNGTDYYLVKHKDTPLDGLTVRMRTRD